MEFVHQHPLVSGLVSIVIALVCLVLFIKSGAESEPNPAESKKRTKGEIALFVAFLVFLVAGIVVASGH